MEASLQLRVDGAVVDVDVAGLADEERFAVLVDQEEIATVAKRIVAVGRPPGWVYALDPAMDPGTDGSRMYPTPAAAITAAGLQRVCGVGARMAFDAGVPLPTPIRKVAKP